MKNDRITAATCCSGEVTAASLAKPGLPGFPHEACLQRSLHRVPAYLRHQLPFSPTDVGRLQRLIRPYVSTSKDLGELLESLES